MEKRELGLVLISAASCAALIGLALWRERAPRAESAKQLAENGFVAQNKSDVLKLQKANIGWNALRETMRENGASNAEANGVLRSAQRAMVAPYPYRCAMSPLWPVSARRGYIHAQRVWLVEAAAPARKIWYCGTGMSGWQMRQLETRNKERCAQRVVVVSPRAPFFVLASYDNAE